jgi:PPOX class probable F420-dependent enzyme
MRDRLSDAALGLLASDAVATLVTLNADGSPRITVVWVAVEDSEIVFATLSDVRKLDNIRRDPRVSLSVLSNKLNEWGLLEYLVIDGTARITEGGAAQMLQRLAYTYIGPDVVFPAMANPPPGYITRITVDRIAGVGPWKAR